LLLFRSAALLPDMVWRHLFGYALIGMVAWFFRQKDPKALIVWAQCWCCPVRDHGQPGDEHWELAQPRRDWQVPKRSALQGNVAVRPGAKPRRAAGTDGADPRPMVGPCPQSADQTHSSR
jgi:hypothetical protein